MTGAVLMKLLVAALLALTALTAAAQSDQEAAKRAQQAAAAAARAAAERARKQDVNQAIRITRAVVVGLEGEEPAAACESLKKPLAREHLHKILGSWVLVWSVTDDPQMAEELRDLVSSSHVELSLHDDDNRTIVFNERNLLKDQSCVNYVLKMSQSSEASERHTLDPGPATVERGGVVQPYNDTGAMDLYESGADALVLVYNSKTGRFLLTYRREGHHSDVEQLRSSESEHEKRAECFGFSVDAKSKFVYDGTADFCHRKSSVEVKSEES